MRRFVLALAVLLGVFAAAVAPAGLASAKPIKNSKKNQVSGPFTGTTTFDFDPTSICTPFASQVFDGTYTVGKGGGTGSFNIQGCAVPQLGTIDTLEADAAVTTPAGVVINGPATGTIDTQSGALDFTLSLPEAGGTVTVHLTGTWTLPAVAGVPSPISGTLTST